MMSANPLNFGDYEAQFWGIMKFECLVDILGLEPVQFVSNKVIPKRLIFYSYKFKASADDNSTRDENGRKFSKQVENTVEKEQLLVTSDFSFSHSVFRRLVQLTCKNQGLFGKGLIWTSVTFRARFVSNLVYSNPVISLCNFPSST